MKKIFLLVAFFATTCTQQIFAQDSKSTQLTPLLTAYYGVKNALVNSNSADAAINAGSFLKTVNSIDAKSLPSSEQAAFTGLQNKLAFDARHMSESKDIAHQREHFANFSANFFKLAKAVKLTSGSIYYDYCPMQKSYWLSAEVAIKNPYFGKQMLTCGKVAEELK
ncbi:DUF3347 domain-containing protein [Mucilaginibacter sp. FT3.2]|uniref:DUF3347 domain-containing protein n=1 Tax=Mucilaginibacter sp. FT3.2 TaxID=2723090 RepID=UPI00160DEB14|nr:DUF3347 domain-containing protein [Mucilaginibacter sp. FT3.2]MBB6233872.1 hypothetical protein [Mucilaginibacter sp. FT3.2]